MHTCTTVIQTYIHVDNFIVRTPGKAIIESAADHNNRYISHAIVSWMYRAETHSHCLLNEHVCKVNLSDIFFVAKVEGSIEESIY